MDDLARVGEALRGRRFDLLEQARNLVAGVRGAVAGGLGARVLGVGVLVTGEARARQQHDAGEALREGVVDVVREALALGEDAGAVLGEGERLLRREHVVLRGDELGDEFAAACVLRTQLGVDPRDAERDDHPHDRADDGADVASVGARDEGGDARDEDEGHEGGSDGPDRDVQDEEVQRERHPREVRRDGERQAPRERQRDDPHLAGVRILGGAQRLGAARAAFDDEAAQVDAGEHDRRGDDGERRGVSGERPDHPDDEQHDEQDVHRGLHDADGAFGVGGGVGGTHHRPFCRVDASNAHGRQPNG